MYRLTAADAEIKRHSVKSLTAQMSGFTSLIGAIKCSQPHPAVFGNMMYEPSAAAWVPFILEKWI